MLSVRALTEDAAFSEIAGDWNRLAGGIPFREWEWCQTWWKHYGGDRQLFVLAVFDGSRCVGIAPFFIARQEPLGHVLRMFGDGEVCADYLSILTLPQDAQRVAKTLADWLQQNHTDRALGISGVPPWDLIELDGLDSECTALRTFLQCMEANGFGIRLSSKVSTWRVPMPNSIEAYAAQLSKQSRRKIRTALKRFDANECQVTIATNKAEFRAIWEQLIELHQRRRNSLGDPGCFASCTFSEFLYDVASRFWGQQRLDLIRVSIGDWVIATELCFRGSETTFAYQLGIAPDSLRENPGWLANAAAIRLAMAQGQSSFDWCRGDEDYKRRLGAKPRICLHCRVVPPVFRSQLWNAALIGQSTVKEWLKTGLNVTGIRP